MIPHSKPYIGEEETEAVSRVLRSGLLAQGTEVLAFEEECAAFIGRRYGVAVNSGTAALHLGLVTLGIGKNDAVIMPSYACAALVHPVLWQRAQPVLCDVTEHYGLDAQAVPARCRAVVVPHLFGAPVPFKPGNHVIEDIAQSIGGSTGKGTPICVASFYATKMLTTGEGGMLLTDDPAIAEEARDRRDYDNRDSFAVRYAYKMTDFQAALGRVQLQRLPGFVTRRREIADQYTAAFQGLPLRLPMGREHVYFRYVVATPRRQELTEYLDEEGVAAKRPVYRPLHHYLGGAFPNAERAHLECLSLPIYPAMTAKEVQGVIQSVLKFFG